MSTADKPTEAVKERINEMKTFSGDDGNRGVMTSSPHNTAGSAQAAIQAALVNTHQAKIAGEPQFPQGRTLFFESQLEGVPFVLASAPVFSEQVNTFDPTKMQRVAKIAIWLVDTTRVGGHYDEQGAPVLTEYQDNPQSVDFQVIGAYLLSQLDTLGFSGMRTRVWTVGYDPNTRMTKGAQKGKPARMFMRWDPPTDVLESKETF